MRFGLDEAAIDRICSVFSAVPAIDSVILYGSRAKGTFRPGSDIDLTIVGREVTRQQLLALANKLDDLLLPNAIDLSLMHEIENADLLDHIRRVGTVVYRRGASQGMRRPREDEIRGMLHAVFHNAGDRLAGHKVVLFGSRARGQARPRSDFDVGVIGETPLPLEDFYALADQIDELPTLYRIDWVDLARASENFRRSAMAATEVLYEA